MGQAIFPRRKIINDGVTIELYKYEVLYKKIKVKYGEASTAIGTCTADTDESFIGWSTDSETVSDVYYTSSSVITPASAGTSYTVSANSNSGTTTVTSSSKIKKIKLYAIFEYTETTEITSETTYEITSVQNKTVEVTIVFNSAQTVTLAARYSADDTWSW